MFPDRLLEQDVKPEAYLYRHYDPSGDLLYSGITLSIPDRTRRHVEKSHWMDSVYLIVIEPFATREEALEAEQTAIRTEFPKYNTVHNGHRHPFQELTQQQKHAERRRLRAERLQRIAKAEVEALPAWRPAGEAPPTGRGVGALLQPAADAAGGRERQIAEAAIDT
jgi:predicted GIY-YIG superfamily endonuclease